YNVTGRHEPVVMHRDEPRPSIKDAVTQSFRDKPHDVLQTTLRRSQNILRDQPTGVELGATRICVHVYVGRGGPRAFELRDSLYNGCSWSGTVVSRRTATGRFASCDK